MRPDWALSLAGRRGPDGAPRQSYLARSKGPQANQIETATEAEAHYVRMCRLRQMSQTELYLLLAGDSAEAAPWVESAARYGLPEAQIRLGQMLLDGDGMAKDARAALTWFTRAADGGAPEAMNMVGRCCENGWGTAEDFIAAAHWYRRSAKAGHDWGQYNYANMLFDGRGVAGDLPQAVVWYRRAADQGHARAMNLLARCYEEGWGVGRDRKLAYDWYRRSAEAGYCRAQYNYATLLTALGRIDEALDWFEKACRGATPESLRAMVDGLVNHGDRRLATLAEQFAPPSLGKVRKPDNARPETSDHSRR